MRNTLVRMVAAALAAPLLTFGLLTVPSAQAHASLIASSPAAGSTVTEQPGVVELTFSEAVQTEFAQVAVLRDDGAAFHVGTPQVIGSVVTQPVGDLPDGNYTISYRVVSADGHPVTGTVDFAAAGADEAEAAATPAPVTPTESGTPGESGAEAGSGTPAESAADEGLSSGLVAAIVAGGAVVVAVIAFLAAGGRRSKPRGDTGP